MAASSSLIPSSTKKRMAEQGLEQKFMAETQKETREVDQMIDRDQQRCHQESDGSSVGSLGSFSRVDPLSENGEELTQELNPAEIEQGFYGLRVGTGPRRCFC